MGSQQSTNRKTLKAGNAFAAKALDAENPITGRLDYNDHWLIWAKFDRTHERRPELAASHRRVPKVIDLT